MYRNMDAGEKQVALAGGAELRSRRAMRRSLVGPMEPEEPAGRSPSTLRNHAGVD